MKKIKNLSLFFLKFTAFIYIIITKILIIKYIKKELKIVLCVIAKQENKYLIEFINYYKNLGFDKIILYDNNNISDETFDNLLKHFIQANFVEIIDFRGLYKPQYSAYMNCYNNNKNIFDWIAFYDVDEFLHLMFYNNIKNFLSSPIFKKCSSILINWKYYGDNNYLFYESKPIIERFKIPFEFPKNYNKDIYLRSAAKTIVRGGLNITWAHFPHFLKSQTICRANGKIIKDPLSSPQYSIAYIKHFATKSTEEFADRLIRGTVNSKNTSNNEYIIQRLKTYYFIFNKITKKKIDLFGKKLGIKLAKFFDNRTME